MIHKFFKTGLGTLITLAAVAFAPASGAAIVNYSTDFESSPTTGNIGDGWINAINQFNADGSYNSTYQYNGGPAPAGGPQVSAIVTGQGGAAQGDQQLSVYSDYDNNTFQQLCATCVETNVFQEQLTDGSESGMWYFAFDAKAGNITGTATAQAFIKVLDASFQPVTNGLITLNTTALGDTWNRYEIAVDFDAIGGGAVRTQFGFQTLTGNYVASGNYYDNISWSMTPIPVPAAVWLFGSGLLGLVGVARRRKGKA